MAAQGSYAQREADLQKQIQAGQYQTKERRVWKRDPAGAEADPQRQPVKGQPAQSQSPSGQWVTETYQQLDPEAANISRQAQQSRLQREMDMLRGEQRGERLFGEGSMGRIEEGLSPDIQNVLAQRRQIAQQGLGADVFQAEREARRAALGRQEQAQARALRGSQAAGGVTGGLAQAQMMRQQEQQQAGRQVAERQMLLDTAQQRLSGIGGLERSATAAQGDILARKKFNLEQRRRELQGRLTTMMGEAGLGVAERSSATAAQAAKEYSKAAASQGGGGKK